MSSTTSTKLKISLSLTNPPRRIPIELPTTPTPSSSTLHQIASNATNIPLSSIRLIYRGKIIPSSNAEGNDVIDQFQLEDGCVVHCMGKPSPSSSVVSPSVPSTAASSSAGSVVVMSPSPPAAAAPSVTPATTTSNTSNQHPLKKALESMKKKHSGGEYTTALSTIAKLLSNIIDKPMEEKYRKVKRTNAAFTKRLGRLSHSHDVMTIIGFVSSNDGAEYVLVPSAEAWPKLTACKGIIDEEIRVDNTTTNTPTTSTTQSNPRGMNNIPDLGFGAIPPPSSSTPGGVGAFGNNNGLFPNMNSQMMDSVLSNPAALQQMMSNPMVQQTIMNDPRLSGNPMMQNAMRTFMNNPGMVQQMSQMMSDPSVRARVDAMMAQQSNFGGSGGPAGGGSMDMAAQMEMMRQFANMSSAANTNTNSVGNQQQNSNTMSNQQSQQNQAGNSNGTTTNTSASTNNDGETTEMTEEEMIAAAIARSLREQ